MNVDEVINDILRREGGYADHPADRGGPTRFGITERVARRRGYSGDMRELPIGLARWIYTEDYIEKPGFGQAAALSEAVAAELVDTGVNMHPRQAADFLQRALNVLGLSGQLYRDLEVDGAVGPKTLGALEAFLRFRGREGERVLLVALNSLQAARYIEIAERDPAQQAFVYGWLRHRVKL